MERPHQYDESFAEAEDKGNRGILADPDEVSEAKEVVVDEGDDEAQKDQHHRRRPRGYPQAGPSRSRARGGRNFQRRTHRVAFANSNSLRKVAGAETEGATFRNGLLVVLNLPAHAAPNVVPIEFGLCLDVAIIERLRVISSDDDALSVELAMIFRLLRRIELAGLGVIADGQAHASLPERIPCDRSRHLAFQDGLDGELDAIDSGHGNFPRSTVASERLDGGKRHIVVRRPDPPDLISVLGQPRVGLL